MALEYVYDEKKYNKICQDKAYINDDRVVRHDYFSYMVYE